MSVTTTFDAEHNLYLISIEGDTNVDELVASYRAIFDHPDFKQNMHAIWDLSHMDLKTKPISDIRQLARELRSFAQRRGDHYKAALVTTRPVDYQLLRLYLSILKLIGSHIIFRLHRSRDEAYEWVERN